MELTGYALNTLVHEGVETQVYQGIRHSDGKRVVLKMVRDEYPSWRVLSRLRHEHGILTGLDLPGVPRVEGMVSQGRRLALVLEDLGPTNLADLIATRGKLDPTKAVSVTITLAKTLAEIHSRRLVHKDIKPMNIMIDEATLEPHFVDFGIAARLGQETQEAAAVESMEGTLAYVAPEQTGRMNRPLDYRADLYSLGVTLYEMLTGQRPFSATEPTAAIFEHLVMPPPPPCSVEPSVPRALSDIVLKLLAKSPEDRYQSARGLVHDLELCQKALVTDEKLESFPLGQNDRPERLVEPARLLGRADELTALTERLAFTRLGEAQLVLVKGPSGIGKSALVRSVFTQRSDQALVFAQGKFDPMTRGTPFAALSSAVHALVHHALGELPAILEQRKKALLNALGMNAQIIVDICPELELLLGPTPKAPDVGAAEAKNRLPIFFRRFLSVFASQHAPLVMFFDDLQWADPASLDLLGRVLVDPELRHTLVVGAYREEEVDAGHALSSMQASMRKASIEPHYITIGPLSSNATKAYVAATLGAAPDEVTSLSEIAWKKTHGNPFFLGQFLHMLVEDGSLHFDGHRGRFVWDAARIENAMVTENVGALMSRKVGRFSADARRALEVGAAIGPVFHLGALSRILQLPASRVHHDLWPVLAEGLVLPLGGDYRFVSEDIDVPEEVLQTITYRFLHDRVKEACYEMVSDAAQARLHLAIARELGRTGNLLDGEKLLDVAGHYDKGASEINDAKERLEVAELELRAGQKAMGATAYQAAAEFFAAGRKLLGALKDGLARDCDFAVLLWLRSAEAEMHAGGFERADALLDELFAESKTSLERAHVHELRVVSYVGRARFADALSAGLAGLAEFGITFPETPEARQMGLGQTMGAVAALFAEQSIPALVERALLDDPSETQAQKLLANLFVPSYLTDPSYYAPLAFELVRRSLAIGHSETSALAYSAYGFLLGAVMGLHEQGMAVSRLSLTLAERSKNPALIARTHLTFVNVAYVREPLRALVPFFRTVRASAVEAGEFVYLAGCCFLTGPLSLAAGVPLAELEVEVEECLALALRTGDVLATVSTKLSLQAIRCFLGKTGNDFDTDAELAKLNEKEHGAALFYHDATMSYLSLLQGDAERAMARATAARKYEISLMGNFWPLYLYYFEALASVVLARKTEGDARVTHLAKAAEARAKLAPFADCSPHNFRHRVALIDAELAYSKNESPWDVLGHYDTAIKLSREYDAPHDEALANELAARFLLKHGRQEAALRYMIDALRGYRHWGAVTKIDALVLEFPELAVAVMHKKGLSSLSRRSQTTAGLTALTQVTSGSIRDAAIVLSAVQLIAGELVLSEVVRKLMRIVMENAGAERGALLLANDGELIVQAKFRASPEQVDVDLDLRLEQARTLAVQPILHAFRTREPLAIDDVQSDPRFTGDPYVATGRPRSILCLPITHQGQTAGILYLETGAVEGAFTAVRVELIGLLASQAAVAIRNAMLVEEIRSTNAKLEKDIEARTREVEQSNAELLLANQKLADQLEERARAEHEREVLREQVVDVQRARLAELSAPMLPITDDVLVMPIVGSVDGERATTIMDIALAGAQGFSARVMILDVTGMRQIDSHALSALLSVANALRLLGTRPILTGVRAEVAQTIIGLGVPLDGLETLSTLQAGIARVLRAQEMGHVGQEKRRAGGFRQTDPKR